MTTEGTGRPLRHRLGAAGTRVSRVALRVLYVGTALLGILFTPPLVVLVLVPAFALAAATLVTVVVGYGHGSWPPRRLVARTALVAAGALPFSVAVDVLGAAGQVVVVVVLALATVVATSRLDALEAAQVRAAPRPGGARGDDGPDGAPGGDGRSLQTLLSAVPLQVLFHEWQAVQEQTDETSCPRHRAAAVQARTLLLDELQRRDPAGFGAWLAEGAVVPPEQHIRDDQGLAA